MTEKFYHNLTPMMAQYLDIKKKTTDCLLFFRMGDFYELFFDDAKIAAPVMDVVLTRRGKQDGLDIPMCGVPFHASDMYLSRLTRAGYKVAVCEQIESPSEAKKRGPKSVVKREITRIVTAGTITDESLLEAKKNNFLLSLGWRKGAVGAAWVDISTGEISVEKLNGVYDIKALVARLEPAEILAPDLAKEESFFLNIINDFSSYLTYLSSSKFSLEMSEETLRAYYGVATIDGFGNFSDLEVIACGVLLNYISETQSGHIPPLTRPNKLESSNVMAIDVATRRNLEILLSLSGERRGSLIDAVDKTLTSAGARALALDLNAPLTSCKEIRKRHEVISAFMKDQHLLDNIKKELYITPDHARSLSRVGVGRAGPRDLEIIRKGLRQSQEVQTLLSSSSCQNIKIIQSLLAGLSIDKELFNTLEIALSDQLPINVKDGNFVREKYDKSLDELREIRDKGHIKIRDMETLERKKTGISSLKIKYNNIWGYFIEVTANAAENLKNRDCLEGYIHRQTLSNAIRYSTADLIDLAAKISNARERAIGLELEIFNDLSKRVLACSSIIYDTSKCLARIDVFSSWATYASSNFAIKPEIMDSYDFDIKSGRHPVIEQSLSNEFVTNDCKIGNEKQASIWLITGPNMAGKSTFLRQNALIVIMAQAGGYVPAQYAKIGIVDKLFSRIGAADDIARGRSTFMVEMIETASILNQASKNSLVILDEIGRGTATLDGLAIAWSVAEYLHESKSCRTLFATHYHELTELEKNFSRISLRTLKVKRWKEELIFLHEVIEGTADSSYGIHVAKLAGLPEIVTQRAKTMLARLENENASKGELSLFDPNFEKEIEQLNSIVKLPEKYNEIIESIEQCDPDNMTARDALNFLYILVEKIKKESN